MRRPQQGRFQKQGGGKSSVHVSVKLGTTDTHVVFVAVDEQKKPLFTIPLSPEEALLIGEQLQKLARMVRARATSITFATIKCTGCDLQGVILPEEDKPAGWHDGCCPSCAKDIHVVPGAGNA